MNRRDMIIVATLMNTGLLAVLFMMAIQSDHSGASEQAVIPPPQNQIAEVTPSSTDSILPHEPTLPMAKTSRHDELDKVINSFATVVPPTPVIMEEDLFQDEQAEPATSLAEADTEIHQVGNVLEPIDGLSVTVKRGDSLDKIARANKTSIKALKKANNLASDRLKIGQVLLIPKNGEVEAEKPVAKTTIKTETPATVASGIEYYTIKNGDNPWKIAKQFGVRFDQLLKLNSLDEAKARRLKAGDKIRVR